MSCSETGAFAVAQRPLGEPWMLAVASQVAQWTLLRHGFLVEALYFEVAKDPNCREHTVLAPLQGAHVKHT